MKNGYKLIWTEKAFIDLNNICNYILINFSEKDVKIFLGKFNKILNLIKYYPEMYPQSNTKPNLRKAVITKNSSLFYQFKGGTIHLVNILDNRSYL